MLKLPAINRQRGAERGMKLVPGIQTVRLIEVIEVKFTIGTGEPDSPIREVVGYWLPDGSKIAEIDRISEG